MNYGGVGFTEARTIPWGPWKEKFCWWPTQIVLRAEYPYDYSYSKYVWFKKIYLRRRLRAHYPENNFEYEYAEDLFDLMKQDRL